MITKDDIKITEIETGIFEATHNEWSSGKGKTRKINRRIARYIEDYNNEEAAKNEEIRFKNAPKKDCPRCGGRGYIDHYLHVAHGVCYKCGGAGKVEIKVKESKLYLKEESSGNWQPLFSEGFM